MATTMDPFEMRLQASLRRAYALAIQLTRNPSDAEDLVQETMVKAWKGRESYVPDRPFLNWLLRIMQHAHLDIVRRANPIRTAEALSDDFQIASNFEDSPDRRLETKESSQELADALAELPEIYRTTIILCDLEGLSYAEIADEQNSTIGTVRSRIYRGRRLLRDILTRKRTLAHSALS